MDAGLSSIPGGGAEILWTGCDSKFRRINARPPVAGSHGHGPPVRVKNQCHHDVRAPGDPDGTDRTSGKIRELQDDTGGFTAFIPWTYQPGGTHLAGEALGAVEYLRTLAISRLVLETCPTSRSPG